MSSVQAIRRAFDVLGALAAGPLGVTDVADRSGLPKSTAARMLATLVHEGAVEQVPGDSRYRLGPRMATLAAGLTPARSLAAVAHVDPRRAGRVGGRGGRPVRPGRRPRPLHRPGRHPEPGLGPRLDRKPGAAPRGLVRAGAAGVPAAGRHRALPRASARAVHATDRGGPGRAARAAARDPSRRVRLGARGVRRGDRVRGGADRRRVRRGHRRGPPPRAVVPLPVRRAPRRRSPRPWSAARPGSPGACAARRQRRGEVAPGSWRRVGRGFAARTRHNGHPQNVVADGPPTFRRWCWSGVAIDARSSSSEHRCRLGSRSRRPWTGHNDHVAVVVPGSGPDGGVADPGRRGPGESRILAGT